MMKLIWVTTSSNTVIWHLHNTLSRASDDFLVYVIGDNVEIYKYVYPDVTFIDLNISRKPSLCSDIYILFKLIYIFKKINPDITHSIMPKSGFITALASFFTRVPKRIHTFTGQVWMYKTGAERWILKLIDYLIIVLNTICLSDSKSQSIYLFHNNLKFNGNPIPILGFGSLSGVDINRYNKESIKFSAHKLRDKLGIKMDEFIFSYIARKTLDKGAIDILYSFQLTRNYFPNIKLLFVGPDEENLIKSLIDQKSSLLENVINIDAVSNHFDYLYISNVLCLPSHREGFGSIVIDAAALAIPTIGNNIPGLSDSIIDGETGILVPPGDNQNFSKAMTMMISNHKFRLYTGNNALTRVEKYFTADIMYSELKKLYLA